MRKRTFSRGVTSAWLGLSLLAAFAGSLHGRVFGLSRLQKKLILLPVDALLVAFSLWAAVATRLGAFWPSIVWDTGWWLLLALPVAGAIVFYSVGLYRVVMRSMGRHGALRITVPSLHH